MMAETIAFLDTNYCLHYPPPDHTDWRKMLDADRVRLVACLGLLDELDDKKDHPTLHERAKRWLRLIKECVKAPLPIREQVSLETYSNPAARGSRNLSKGDASIVEQAKEFVATYSPPSLVVITEDAGMISRCSFAGLQVVEPDPEKRLPNPQTENEKLINELRRELHVLKHKAPDLKLLAFGGDEFTEGVEPLKFTLKKPRPQSFRDAVDAFMQREKVTLQHWPEDRYAMMSAQYYAWAENQNVVRDESARTMEMRVHVENCGRAPASDVEASISWPRKQIACVVAGSAMRGSRQIPMAFPPFIRNRFFDVTKQEMREEIPTVDGARAVPAHLSGVSEQPYQHAGAVLGYSDFTIGQSQLGHGKSTSRHFLYFTFKSWDDVKPFELAVKVYAINPPIDENYAIPIIPTVVEL